MSSHQATGNRNSKNTAQDIFVQKKHSGESHNSDDTNRSQRKISPGTRKQASLSRGWPWKCHELDLFSTRHQAVILQNYQMHILPIPFHQSLKAEFEKYSLGYFRSEETQRGHRTTLTTQSAHNAKCRQRRETSFSPKSTAINPSRLISSDVTKATKKAKHLRHMPFQFPRQ